MIDQRPLSAFKFTQSEYDLYQSGVEIWRDIEGYEGLYQASTNGRVKSLYCRYFGKETILSQGLSKNGYYLVVFCKNKIRKNFSVHQLIAMVFLGHIPSGYKLVVNHKDTIATNNELYNLEITTQRVNANLKHIPHSSIYTGVSWVGHCNKWKAEITIKSKRKYLGLHINEYDAHTAYEDELKIVLANGL